VIDRSATEPGGARAAPTWFVLGLIAAAGLLAYVVLWRGVERPGSFFGGDLVAYSSAADRLAATGSPYHPALFLGPIVSGDDVSIGYFYPPILAQLFLPLRSIPPFALAVGWSAAQVVCLAILLPIVYAGGSRPTLDRALLAIGFGLAFYPLEFATFSGNVSGWLAIGVAMSLAAGARIQGAVAAVAAVLKLLPLPMFVVAVMDRRSRLAAVTTAVSIIAVSLLLAPQAWSDFVTVLPNILRIGTAAGYTNLSPAHALEPFGLLGFGLLVGWIIALGFGIAAVLAGAREGYSHRVLAMAVVSLTFASSTLWDHYLGVFVPLILWAWPGADTNRRRAMAVFVIVAMGLWLRLDTVPGYRVLFVAALVACSLAITTTRERVASREAAVARVRVVPT
jgi:hypothetical protein